MIREMKLKSPSSPSMSKKTSDTGFKSASSAVNKKYSNLSPCSPYSPYEANQKYDASLESTFYNTFKGERTEKLKEKEDPILENLKQFVSTTSSLKSLRLPESSPNVVFTSKDYFPTNDYLLDSIYNEKSTKKKNKRSLSTKLYCSFDKEEHKKMEDLLRELKVSVFGKLSKEISEKSQQHLELSNNVDILSHRLKVYKDKLQNYKEYNCTTINDTTKIEYYSERVYRENSHMESEINLLRKRIEDMKNETFEKDRESRQIRYDIIKEESDVAYLQEETRRLNREVLESQNEMKNLKAAILFVKKRNDELKDKVMRKDCTSKEFISEVNTLLKRGKTFY